MTRFHVAFLKSLLTAAFFSAGLSAAGAQNNPAPDQQGSTMPNALQGFARNRNEPVKIDANRLEVHDKDKLAIFSGNVYVQQGDTNMRCRRRHRDQQRPESHRRPRGFRHQSEHRDAFRKRRGDSRTECDEGRQADRRSVHESCPHGGGDQNKPRQGAGPIRARLRQGKGRGDKKGQVAEEPTPANTAAIGLFGRGVTNNLSHHCHRDLEGLSGA